MAGLCPGIREVEHPAVGAGHCAANERLTNLLTRPAFSWKGRNRTALQVDSSLTHRYLPESGRLTFLHQRAVFWPRGVGGGQLSGNATSTDHRGRA